MIVEFEHYRLDIDVERTRQFYKTAPLSSATCSCSGCRNYEKAIDLLPQAVLSFFEKLGIEMKKIREVCVHCVNADDAIFYGGFYHLCGKLLEGESAWIPLNENLFRFDEDKLFRITNDFGVSFQNDCDLLESDFPLPAIQLEISADMPWVLSERNDYPQDSSRRKRQ